MCDHQFQYVLASNSKCWLIQFPQNFQFSLKKNNYFVQSKNLYIIHMFFASQILFRKNDRNYSRFSAKIIKDSFSSDSCHIVNRFEFKIKIPLTATSFFFQLSSLILIGGFYWYYHYDIEKEDNHNNEHLHGNQTHNHTYTAASTTASPVNWETNEDIQLLRGYLRIASVHPDINYG